MGCPGESVTYDGGMTAGKRRGIEASKEASIVQELRDRIEERQPRMVRMLAELVRVESPSGDKAAVDRAVALVAGWCEKIEGRVKLHRQREFGDLLEVRFRPDKAARFGPNKDGRFGPRKTGGRGALLVLGHLDTVWELGTLKRMPWQEKAGRIHGPGVLDMKSGVVMAITAIESLLKLGALSRPIVLLLHSDEEVGSPCSRALTERVARECEAVYVIEPAQGEAGAYKTARKGVGSYRVEVTGVAAHSGIDFSKGHSAVVELAHQIERVASFTDLERGITVNPGVIGGGTRTNVVAAQAWMEVDLRVARMSDAARVDRSFRKLKAQDKGCKVEVSGGLNRPPMERTKGVVQLFRKAQAMAAELGIALEEASTGGGSDGNFTAALGIPTLDGMGAVGAGAHAEHEHILAKHLVPRTALLAAMML